MEKGNEFIKLINKEKKYSAFVDNDFINTFIDNNQLMFKDKGHKSIGFLPDINNLVFERLKDIFEIEDTDLFKKKFDEAVSGDGSELLNMLTIWSSSLCALLCFYNINEDNPLEITIENIECKFTEVHFEVKNKVFRNPSNIDVVLIGKENKENKENKVILFLESKFAEYLSKEKYDFSESYINYLKEKQVEDVMPIINSYKNPGLLKQLIAHYIGLDHFTNDKFYSFHKDEERYNVYKFYHENKDVHVFLKEIIFNNDNDEVNEYINKLEEVEKHLTWNDKVKVLSPTTYQDFFKDHFKMNPRVKEFYKLNIR